MCVECITIHIISWVECCSLCLHVEYERVDLGSCLAPDLLQDIKSVHVLHSHVQHSTCEQRRVLLHRYELWAAGLL